MNVLDSVSDTVMIEEAIGSVEKEVSRHNAMNYGHIDDCDITNENLSHLEDSQMHELIFDDDPNIHHAGDIDDDFSLDGSLAVPMPETEDLSSPSTKKIKGSKKPKRKFGISDPKSQSESGKLNTRTSWQQKRVQIRTLEGAFSVTMWASGRYC